MLADADSRLIVVFGNEVLVLDAAGRATASFPLDTSWKELVLASGRLVATNGTELLAMGLDGAPHWRKPAKGTVVRMHVTPDDGLVVWSRRTSNEIRVESDITRYDDAGEALWSTIHAVPPVGLVSPWSLAFDDAGHLFAFAFGRVGDGVSGNDIATGGVATYDPSGRHLASIVEDGNMSRNARGLAHGAVVLGYETRAYDERGALKWSVRRDTDEVSTLSALGVELLKMPMAEALPPVIRRGPGSYLQVNATDDGGGDRYFIHEGRVVCIDASLALRWSLELPGAKGWSAPAIGPDQTLLVASEDGHLTSID